LKWINPTKIPFITGVISHLLSGMSHQVESHQNCRAPRNPRTTEGAGTHCAAVRPLWWAAHDDGLEGGKATGGGARGWI